MEQDIAYDVKDDRTQKAKDRVDHYFAQQVAEGDVREERVLEALLPGLRLRERERRADRVEDAEDAAQARAAVAEKEARVQKEEEMMEEALLDQL